MQAFDPRRKVVEGWGKLRRFWLSRFRKGRVGYWHNRRRGECKRCGACCSIMFRCPHLQGVNQCGIYEKRYKQCSLFPIDPRDLRYLHDVCGFWFDSGEKD